ncbi:hypothetical protein PoB_006541000 [Plakobranchus ocellatus]|uniref:Uncharacterized protein n=1 Tax=Plakobranchus ocellatus TaxID=259542 RepID=A0AAV4D436_9GAST|nr:hypothetical protein PoB_006541000 [Plakobranchus ocellatus]
MLSRNSSKGITRPALQRNLLRSEKQEKNTQPQKRIVEDNMKIRDRPWKERPSKAEIKKQNGSLSFADLTLTRNQEAVAGMNWRQEVLADFRATLNVSNCKQNTWSRKFQVFRNVLMELYGDIYSRDNKKGLCKYLQKNITVETK